MTVRGVNKKYQAAKKDADICRDHLESGCYKEFVADLQELEDTLKPPVTYHNAELLLGNIYKTMEWVKGVQEIHELVDHPEYPTYSKEFKIWQICNRILSEPVQGKEERVDNSK